MRNTALKVLFVGETWTVTRIHTKGFDVVELGGYEDYSGFLTDALQSDPGISVDHLPNHRVLDAFPRSLDELQAYGAVVISDCGQYECRHGVRLPDPPSGQSSALVLCGLLSSPLPRLSNPARAFHPGIVGRDHRREIQDT